MQFIYFTYLTRGNYYRKASALLLCGFASTITFAQDDGVTLSDGQILQIVETLNDAEIKQAKEAQDESDNADVKQLAAAIIADHENANEQMGELLKGDINRNESSLNEMLESETSETHEALQDLDGAAYDCAYLRVQVQQHQKAIELAETNLIPDANNAGVKQYLTAMAPRLEHHLELAKAGMAKLPDCK